MKIKHDTHLHTDFSADSTTPMSTQASHARELGLSGICITDHVDYDYPTEKYEELSGLSFSIDWNDYKSTIREISGQYNDLNIYLGVECGLKTNSAVVEKNRLLSSDPDFDQVIGSIHLIDNNDPYFPETWANQAPDRVMRRYFEITLENIEAFTDFNTLGHLDYAVRYAPKDFDYKPEDYFEITDEIMKRLIRNNIALEINTSALKKGFGFTNPHPAFIQRYYDLGGRLITIGSDAHDTDGMAFAFDETAYQLRKIGFSEYAIFIKRKPKLIEID